MSSTVYLCAAQQATVVQYVEYNQSSHSLLNNLVCQLHWVQTHQVEVGRDATSNFHASCPPLPTCAHKP